MSYSLSDLIRRAWASIFTPREVAAEILALRIDRTIGWQLLFAVVLVSVVLTEAMALLFAGAAGAEMATPIAGPMALAVVQVSLTVLMVFATYWVGRAFGGQGRFADAILLVAWLQFVLLCLQVVQMLALLLIPVFAFFIGVAAVVLFFWLLTNFVAALHGFQRLGRVFGGVVASFFALGLVMMIVFALIGVQIPEVPQNV
jgi:hypothetical protein